MKPLGYCGLAATFALTATYGYRRAHQADWTPPGGRVEQTSSLSVRCLGDAGPPVLLLHGLVASGMYWGGAYDRMAERHRLVVPDLLGFGLSPRPPSGYGPDDHVDAVAACLDDLGIDEPVVIGAHSLGGLVALRFALNHPRRVKAVVAFGPPVYPDARAARAHVSATSTMGRLFVLPGRTAEHACHWLCEHRDLAARLAVVTHPGLPPAIAADGVRHTWTSYSETLQLVILALEATSWLERVSCPVLLVAGDKDPVVDHAHLRRLAGTSANIGLQEQAGGHHLPLRNAAACAALIETTGRMHPSAPPDPG